VRRESLMGRFSQPPGPMYFKITRERRSRPRVRRRLYWKRRVRRGSRKREGAREPEGAMSVSEERF